jgi:hypothetical protein
LAANIPVKNNVKRRAYKVDFILYGASEELASYILINAPSFGVVQKSTQYTNIRNGLGIFSSRNQSSINSVPVSHPNVGRNGQQPYTQEPQVLLI